MPLRSGAVGRRFGTLQQQAIENLDYPLQSLWFGLEPPLNCHSCALGMIALRADHLRRFESYSSGNSSAHFDLVDNAVGNRVQLREEADYLVRKSEVLQVLLGPRV